ncbi:MAG: oxygenase MpaB family protein [Aeromicrobium sp.]
MTFGPGSILWETYGERLGYLLAPREGLLQLMYPDLGRGVEQHSAFYDEPWERLFRSVPQIVGTIYNGPNAQMTADKVREYHRDIKGTHDDGRRYHALDPDTYFWAHATFIDAVLTSNEMFGKPFTLEEKRLLYVEGIQWWQMYGLSMRPVPPNYDEFLEYWNHHVENVLEPTVSASRLVEMMKDPLTMDQPWIPERIWRMTAPTGGGAYRWVMAGTLPPPVREKFDIPWTAKDQARFDKFRKFVIRSWPLLPGRIRYLPPVRAGYKREGHLGRDAAFELASKNHAEALT